MSVPPEPVVIAQRGGLVVAERGPEVLVIDRGNGASETTAFVLAVVTLVFGGFGIVAVVLANTGAMSQQAVLLGAGLLAIGIVAAVGTLLTVKSIRERRRSPLNTFVPVAVFDRAQRMYCDGNGAAIAPLDQVHFERQMQLTSSSPRLVAVTPYGERVLKRGNPFGGGIGALDQVLTHAVHGYRR